MTRKIWTLPLAVGLCTLALGRADAQSSDAAFAARLSDASSTIGAAMKDQRALTASALPAAAEPAADTSKLKSFSLASNDSNSPEIFREVVDAGAVPDCKDSVMDDGGFPMHRQTCSVVGKLDRVTVIRNEIFWGSKKIVKVVGDVSCRQRWLKPGGRHAQRLQLWTFCDFQGTVE